MLTGAAYEQLGAWMAENGIESPTEAVRTIIEVQVAAWPEYGITKAKRERVGWEMRSWYMGRVAAKLAEIDREMKEHFVKFETPQEIPSENSP